MKDFAVERRVVRIGLGLVLLATGGCSPSHERAAECSHPPFTGITATDAEGNIVSTVDLHDWACPGGPPAAFGVGRIATPPIPVQLCLYPAAPNPAASSTRLRISLRTGAPVTIAVYGQRTRPIRAVLVRTIVERTMTAGSHDFSWDLRDDRNVRVEPGIYRVIVSTDGAMLCGDVSVTAAP